MDKIVICELALMCHVGVPDEERSKPQRLMVTIEMERDLRAAAERDDISRTIDYDAVAQRVRKLGSEGSWKLIERLAGEIATVVLQEFGPDVVTVEVKKFIIPDTRHVSVHVRRQRG